MSTCEAARIRSPGLLCGSISGELRGIRVEDQIRQIGAGQFPQVLGVDGALKNAGVYWCIYVMFYVRVCIYIYVCIYIKLDIIYIYHIIRYYICIYYICINYICIYYYI